MAAVIDPVPTAPPSRARGRFPHFPALDGLRGLAVLVLVLYGLDTRLAKGGHLGATTLFTLMGFLAMASLLASRSDQRGISLGAFWGRRIRRILGLSLVALVIAGAFGIVAADALQRHRLALDGLSALLSVANWRMIATHQVFGPASGYASPVRQFWLLAVVGQVVLVVSLLAVLLLDVAHWSRQRLGAVLGVLTAASVIACFALHHSPARALYGTDTRAAEVLVGCLLAIVIYDPRVTIRLAMPGPIRDTINVVGVLGGLFLLLVWAALGPTKYLLLGGLFIVSLASASVVLACIVPEGPVPRLLSMRPFRELGRIAIALYLVYWPVYVWLSPQHVSLHGTKLNLLRLVVVFVAAIVLQLIVERVRNREHTPARPAGRTIVAVSVVAALLVAGGLYAVTKTGPKVSSTVEAAASTTTTTAKGGPPPTVAFYGDALASTLEQSAKSWADQTGKIKVVDGVASPTCGIDRDGVVQNAAGASVPIPSECSTWDSQWATSVAAEKPDFAVVVTGISEMDDHRPLNNPTFTGPGNSTYDYQLYLLMSKAVDVLAANGTKVIWLNLPNFAPGSGAASDPSRVAVFNSTLAQLGQHFPDQVQIAPFGAWIAANGAAGAEPDENGFGPSVADHVVTDYLGPLVLGIWEAQQNDSTTTTAQNDSASTGPTVSLLPPPPGVNVSTHTSTNKTDKSGKSRTSTSKDTTRTTRAPGSTRTTQGG